MRISDVGVVAVEKNKHLANQEKNVKAPKVKTLVFILKW